MMDVRKVYGAILVALVVFLAYPTLSLAASTCSPPGAIPADAFTALIEDEGDTVAVGQRTPLILIHGIHGNKREDTGTDLIGNPNRDYWLQFLTHFQVDDNFRKQYKIYRFHYVSDMKDGTVTELGRALRNKIDGMVSAGSLPDRPFVIIAHSMGGLVARSYMQQHCHWSGVFSGQNGGERILKLITLATPHHGSPGANQLSRDELSASADVHDSPYMPFWNPIPGTRTNTWTTTIGVVSYFNFLGSLQYTDPNRSDLLWDNYDGMMIASNPDINLWLQALNNDEGPDRAKYDGKLVTYSGFIDRGSATYNDRLSAVYSYLPAPLGGPQTLFSFLVAATLAKNQHDQLLGTSIFMGYGLYNGGRPYLANDGLVPFGSAAFERHSVFERVSCPGYDHLDMKDSQLPVCDGGLTLFESLQALLGSLIAAATGRSDFNGDGKADLLWQNQTTGAVIVWYMNGPTMLDAVYLYAGGLPDWKVVGSGDFNGDGKADLLWQNQTTGAVIVWYMNGPTMLDAKYLYTGGLSDWKVVGAADFNGDGKADLLWQNQTTGAVIVWYMNGPTMLDAVYLYPGGLPDWKVMGSGDFNGDGKADLLWQNQTTGAVIVWYLDGTTILGSPYLYAGGLPDWKVVGPK